jgi:hypothetical protein
MADVEMTDPAAAAPKGKKVAAATGDTDGKKRFEVKKVYSRQRMCRWTAFLQVETDTSHDSSGTPSLSGLGILSSTIAPSAATTLWTCVSIARPTTAQLQVKSALSLGVSAM